MSWLFGNLDVGDENKINGEWGSGENVNGALPLQESPHTLLSFYSPVDDDLLVGALGALVKNLSKA